MYLKNIFKKKAESRAWRHPCGMNVLSRKRTKQMKTILKNSWELKYGKKQNFPNNISNANLGQLSLFSSWNHRDKQNFPMTTPLVFRKCGTLNQFLNMDSLLNSTWCSSQSTERGKIATLIFYSNRDYNNKENEINRDINVI